MRIGDVEVLPLDDGVCRMEPDFYVGLDFERHPDLLSADGRVHIPIGCFLVRSGGTTVLVDAGAGPVEEDWVSGGRLPAALRAAGVAPSDIDVVACTHLHIDHIGWLAVDGTPFFPNATVRYGRGDWTPFVEDQPAGDRGREILEALDRAGRLEPLDGDDVTVAAGLTARHTPGHTPGHYGFVVASGGARAYILGDAVECPLQVAEPDFHALSDMDPALAARTREALLRELEGDDVAITGSHFPGLVFGRILLGEGRRYFAPC